MAAFPESFIFSILLSHRVVLSGVSFLFTVITPDVRNISSTTLLLWLRSFLVMSLSCFDDLPLAVSPSPVPEDFISFLLFNSFEFKVVYTSSRDKKSLPNSEVSLKHACILDK